MSQNQKGFAFGISVIGFAALWSVLIYKLLEPLDLESLRGLAVFVFGWALPIGILGGSLITRAISLREVKAHERGMDKGLDKIAGMAERVATTRTNMVTTIKRPVEGWSNPQPYQPAHPSDYLPRPQVSFKSHAACDEIEGL